MVHGYLHLNTNNWHNITVEKGSVCVNGVSLTVVNSGDNHFSVAVIPLHIWKTQILIKLKLDSIGKYWIWYSWKVHFQNGFYGFLK